MAYTAPDTCENVIKINIRLTSPQIHMLWYALEAPL